MGLRPSRGQGIQTRNAASPRIPEDGAPRAEPRTVRVRSLLPLATPGLADEQRFMRRVCAEPHNQRRKDHRQSHQEPASRQESPVRPARHAENVAQERAQGAAHQGRNHDSRRQHRRRCCRPDRQRTAALRNELAIHPDIALIAAVYTLAAATFFARPWAKASPMMPPRTSPP
jgi:hypothetical protein